MAAFVEGEEKREQPLQLILTGNAADNYSFSLQEENLAHVLDQVPSGMPVSVVSVVGAFRTGKSFLLTWFLRYLSYQGTSKGDEWMLAQGDKLAEGNANVAGSPEAKSFAWRGGKERMTTGIWVWSRPFIRELDTGGQVAVLLVDTQGMFDNETGMGLTACIFGLSTLISAYQIYNVDKRIQEDHLQQLALFSEYGRMALAKEGEEGEGQDGAEKKGASPTLEDRPFQRLEFLVRDWQNYEEEEDLENMRKEMTDYLKEVIRDRGVKDLQDTREQITACFEKISCFGLSHPGFEVVKKTYDGSISKMEPLFKSLLNIYVRQVFDASLEPKRIHGRHITAPELKNYMMAYTKLFAEGASFPEAKTMLAATAEANNANAKTVALLKYKSEMDRASSNYRQPDVFTAHHALCLAGALAVFSSIATMGRADSIEKALNELRAEIDEEYKRYSQLNSARNPFQNLEYYLLPMCVATCAFVLRWIADWTCAPWSDTCKLAADGLGHIYVGVFTFMLILSAGKIKRLVTHLSSVLPVLLGQLQ
ncbi:unnamed protein product, partial [Chrysoparadoxa australica]